VIAGAGTVALEILEDRPDIDVIVAPVGGGGLISGVAALTKGIAPQVETVGVEADVSNAFQQSVAAGRITRVTVGSTIADGLGGNMDPDTITFEIIQRVVDRLVTVSEDALIAAIRGLVTEEHLVVEGAGAAAIAAVIEQRIELRGRRTALVVSGSNIDATRLAGILRTA
jgi:threonine dehydratase